MSVMMEPVPAKPEAPVAVKRLLRKCPLTGAIRNYKIAVNKFGGYPRGSVVPEWVLLRSAGSGATGREEKLLDSMVSSGKVVETYEPVNVELRSPETKALAVPSDLVSEANESREKVKSLAADLLAVSADRDAARAEIAGRDKSLGQMSADIAGLQAQIAAQKELLEAEQAVSAALKAQVDSLTAELEEATKPAKGGKK